MIVFFLLEKYRSGALGSTFEREWHSKIDQYQYSAMFLIDDVTT